MKPKHMDKFNAILNWSSLWLANIIEVASAQQDNDVKIKDECIDRQTDQNRSILNEI